MKKLLPLLLLTILPLRQVQGQERTVVMDTSIPDIKPWFGDFYLGYNLRTAKMDPGILNPFGARSGFKLGADINRYLKNRRIALGASIEWTVSSLTTGGITNPFATNHETIHTLYIAPVLTFMQPDRRGGFLYEDLSFGYVMYVEKMSSLDQRALPKPLVGKGETVGLKVSLGYKRNCWDLKYAIFLSSLSTVRVTQGKKHVATLKTDQPIGLGAMSFTIGYTF